ncbi:hypothetical protein IGI04_025831 [Brassica rapa subsp. trilocularis]|uniref:Uncharacterized protein n=1 Tax=Brassica rapa subsp. trilocularis TaxID=1813537 RepID=A0ABQ7KUM0_BRACM|nr:hypothetical protein IGI04_025831 [Brassica rapa subsp. trilocularis]
MGRSKDWSKNSYIDERVQEKSHSFATCKELKLLGSQGMYVVFAKYDQGLDALEVEDGMCVQMLFGFFDQWFQGSGANIELQRSSQHEETLIRTSHWRSRFKVGKHLFKKHIFTTTAKTSMCVFTLEESSWKSESEAGPARHVWVPKAKEQLGLRDKKMQAPKFFFWWSLCTGDSVAGHVTAEETRHRVEFDLEKAVRFDEYVQGGVLLDKYLFKSEDDSGWKHVFFRFSAWDSVEICFCISGIRGESKEPTKSDVQEKVFIQVIVKDNLRITVGLLAVEVVMGRASGKRFQGKATKESSGCIELNTYVMLGGNLFKEY